MNTVKALLLFLTFTWQEKAAAAIPTKSTASTTRTTTSPASPYNVVCTSTEEAKLTLTDNSYKADFPPGCHATGPLYTLNTSCLGGTIFIYKQPISATKVIGGDGTIALTITCVVPPDGVTATPVIVVKMTASVSPTVESHPFTAVTMTLSTTDPSTNPTVASQATLGEHLYLVISSEAKASGGDNFLIPESCSAKDGGDNVDLWNLKQSGKTKCGSLEPTLFGNFTVDNNVVRVGGKDEDITYADIYAFKFKTRDTITYRCTVLVCPKSGKGQCSTELTSMTNSKCLTKTTRKRRSLDSKRAVPHVRKTVSATLTVSDFQGLSEGSQARVEGLLLLVAMFTSVLSSK